MAVVGRIAGRYLPNIPVRIGDVTVEPLPEGVQVLECLKGLKATPTDEAYQIFYIGRSGNVEVDSRCYFWIDKIAKSPEFAIEATLVHDIPLLQIAFSLRNDEIAYRVEVLCVTADGQKYYGNFVSINFFNNVNISCCFFSRSAGVCDNPARDQLDDLEKTEQRTLTRSHIISRYIILADCVSQEVSGAPGGVACSKCLRLQAVLISKKFINKKLSAVREATTGLDRLEGRYLNLRIASAADKLKMSDNWKRAAHELARLRNTRLGHARSRTQDAEQTLVQWSGVEQETGYTALRLAREMLMAYVDRSQ